MRMIEVIYALMYLKPLWWDLVDKVSNDNHAVIAEVIKYLRHKRVKVAYGALLLLGELMNDFEPVFLISMPECPPKRGKKKKRASDKKPDRTTEENKKLHQLFAGIPDFQIPDEESTYAESRDLEVEAQLFEALFRAIVGLIVRKDAKRYIRREAAEVLNVLLECFKFGPNRAKAFLVLLEPAIAVEENEEILEQLAVVENLLRQDVSGARKFDDSDEPQGQGGKDEGERPETL